MAHRESHLTVNPQGSGWRSTAYVSPSATMCEDLARIVATVQDRRHQHRVTNWPAYDASLCHRGTLTVWFTDEAIAAWAAELRTTRGGQP